MPQMTFVEQDGTERTVDAPLGLSVLEIAHKHGIDLEGACEALWPVQPATWLLIRPGRRSLKLPRMMKKICWIWPSVWKKHPALAARLL